MRMFTFCMLAGWFFTFPVPSAAQDWSTVRQLAPGARLRVELPTQVVEERLREVTDQQLLVDGRAVQRADIQQIDWIRGHNARDAGRGFLAGIGVGMAHSFLTARSNKLVFGIYLGSFYGTLGALFGAGVSEPATVTVYRR